MPVPFFTEAPDKSGLVFVNLVPRDFRNKLAGCVVQVPVCGRQEVDAGMNGALWCDWPCPLKRSRGVLFLHFAN